MVKRSIEKYPTFNIYTSSLQNQLFISASVTEATSDKGHSVEEIYSKIADILSASSSKIIHERCFGNIGIHNQILDIRTREFLRHNIETNTPITYIEGESCTENKFAGVQIRALIPTEETGIKTILDQGIPKGRVWNLNGSKFLMLHNVDGKKFGEKFVADRKSRTRAMFEQAKRLLETEGAAYSDVVRTWIYISDILDWYGDFNIARNSCYSDFGLLGNSDSPEKAENIYLPASTGIEGRNPSSMPVTMDVLAIRRSQSSKIQIRPIYGSMQRSAFRYGSAFSRAIVIEEPSGKLILVSGTAAIDEQGNSIYLGNTEAQIRHTLNVVSSLVADEGATFQDLCEATIFLKHTHDFAIYQRIAEEINITNAPSVNVNANVCRDELLFEIDAAFILEKK